MLLFEALTLLSLLRDQTGSARNMMIALLVGVVALTLPQGYLLGLLIGTLIVYGFKTFGASNGDLANTEAPISEAR